MKKPGALRTLAVIAALISLTGIILNIIMVMSPHIAAVILGYGNVKEMMEAKLDSVTTALMTVQALIPLVLTLLCAVNIFPENTSRSRSLFTLTAAPAAFIAQSLAASFIYTRALKESLSGGMNTVQLLSAITTVRSVLSYMQVFALVMIMCAASVEYYISRTDR